MANGTDNPLMPGTPDQAPGQGLALNPTAGAPQAAAGGLINTLEHQHGYFRAMYQNLSQTQSKLAMVGDSLAKLVKLGPAVTVDDVMEQARGLVAAGVEPKALASVLADMPPGQGGEPLAGWVIQHSQTVAQRAQALAPLLAQSRQELGASAIRLLAGHHLTNPARSAPRQPDQIPLEGQPPAGNA